MKLSTQINNHLLFIIQLLGYASIPVMLLYANFQDWIIAAICTYLIFNVGISVTYHRLCSHRSFEVGSKTKAALSLLGAFATHGSPVYWSALHTTHHKYSDSEKDVHSPRFGLLKTWFLPMYPVNPVDSTKIAIRLAKEPFQLWLHKYYWLVVLSYVTLVYLIDPFAVVYAYLIPVAWGYIMVGIVNVLCHTVGDRNHETKDNSKNIQLLSWITNGESFHNNHHARPSSPNFGEDKFDLGYWFIKLVRLK